MKRLKDSMTAIFGGSGKAHQIGVFEDGAKPKTVGSPLKDLEFVASQNMTRTDVAIMFNLPPNKLGGSPGTLTYATVEMNQTAIAVDAIAPLVKTISDALSQDPSLMPQNITGLSSRSRRCCARTPRHAPSSTRSSSDYEGDAAGRGP
jgi:phage portal protein BeeE